MSVRSNFCLFFGDILHYFLIKFSHNFFAKFSHHFSCKISHYFAKFSHFLFCEMIFFSIETLILGLLRQYLIHCIFYFNKWPHCVFKAKPNIKHLFTSKLNQFLPHHTTPCLSFSIVYITSDLLIVIYSLNKEVC